MARATYEILWHTQLIPKRSVLVDQPISCLFFTAAATSISGTLHHHHSASLELKNPDLYHLIQGPSPSQPPPIFPHLCCSTLLLKLTPSLLVPVAIELMIAFEAKSPPLSRTVAPLPFAAVVVSGSLVRIRFLIGYRTYEFLSILA
ncbi:hypothetical protein CRG98_000639 [Punica granatum]|uniref:Uncharacterized protein n=1 Tax=Punica granatum TaxID=22663 RepID=A0A2I0LE98_PUNGR|nr:hypothetical protein CRG98_000639 [Punica granatum]